MSRYVCSFCFTPNDHSPKACEHCDDESFELFEREPGEVEE